MIHSIFHSSASRRRGFSLIELMIALLLGTLVVAGLINVLIANRQAYHLQEANNFNQQNMRFAMDRIGWSLRMADFWGGVDSTSVIIDTSAKVTGLGFCNQSYVLSLDAGVFGYDGQVAGGTSFPVSGCIGGGNDTSNYVAGSDVLVVRYADTDAVPTSGGTSGIVSKKIYLQARTGVRGELFANTVPADLPNTDQGVSTYPYAMEMYYLRPCSDPGTGGACTAASDGGHPIPTLMRLRLQDDGTLINEPVVEGVEQLQFEYGVKAAGSSDATPIAYVDADAVTDWADVTSVRVGYVLRSQTRDTGLPHDFDSGGKTTADANYATRLSSNCEYGITSTGGAKSWGCDNYAIGQLGSSPQQFTRAQMTAVVQVRNRMRLIKG